jgi:SynChlorMet cassette radical SAM/SPASM protein ScmE
MKVLSAPEKVTLNLTNRCNLNCLYCAVSATKNAPGDLALEQWQSIIDELARIKVFHLAISGGEPFLCRSLLSILVHIHRHPFRVSINTNATRMDEKILSYLSCSKRLDYIQVSLDGPNAEVHDQIRGLGSFKQLVKGVDLLRSYDIPFFYYVVVHKSNQRHIGEMVRFGRSTGASQVAFSTLVPQGNALGHLNELLLPYDDQKQVEDEMRRLKNRYPHFVGGTLVQAIEWMDAITRRAGSRSTVGGVNIVTSCGGSISECAIRPDGGVIPCDRLWQYTVGDVKKNSLQFIWRHGQGFKKFRERYRRRIDSFAECRGCAYADLCRGGCPATPYGLGKGIDGWDPLSCYRVFVGQKEFTIAQQDACYGNAAGH